MKNLLIAILFVASLSAWIPLLLADHALRQARNLSCLDCPNDPCFVIAISRNGKQIGFYGRYKGKTFRVKEFSTPTLKGDL